MIYGDGRLPARVWEKVFPEPNTGCWLWAGHTNPAGYGQVRWGGRAVLAHRLMLMISSGEPGEGLFTLHSCDQPSCVNPDHLRWGTHSDNMQDAVKRGRHSKVKVTHCPDGHAYSQENTYVYRGRRHCRPCNNEKSLRKYHRNRADAAGSK